jgi:hypothetical protein
MVSRIHVQSPYYGSPYYGEGGTTNVQLPRVVAVVLEGYAAMLSRDLRIEKTRVQSQVCRSAVTVGRPVVITLGFLSINPACDIWLA